MKIENLISSRLTEKLVECGLFKKEIFTTEKLDTADRLYLDISTCGQQISYITKDRLSRFIQEDCATPDYWDEELRRKFAIKTRPGRVVQHIFGSELPYSDQRKLKRMLFDDSNYEVVVVTGDDIPKYYNRDNYEERRGELGSSCMSGCPSSFFMMYKKYCEMAVVMNKTTGKITARAVIFKNCKSGSGKENKDLMCRIYATDDMFYDILKDWGIANGFWIFNGGYSAREFITGHDETYSIDRYKPYFETEEYLQSEQYFIPYLDNFEYCVAYPDVEGKKKYIITPHYGFAPCDSYDIIRYDGNHCTQGGDGIGDRYDYCEGCDCVCSDCYKDAHGGWDYDSYDDDYDYEDDDSEW